MRIAIVLICIAWCTLPGFSQDLLEFKVKELFEENAGEVPVEFFHGRLDGMEEIVIAMACDKKDCRGVLRYVKSKEELVLKGISKKEQITFNEYNLFGKISGKIIANRNQDNLTGWWSSIDENIYFDFDLKKVVAAPSVAASCAQENWIRRYTDEQSSAKMLVQKINTRDVSGSLYLDKFSEGYQLLGSITDAGYYDIDIYESNKIVGNAICGFSGQEIQKVIFKWTDGTGEQILFKQNDQFLFGCANYGDFVGSYSMTYPITNFENINTWFEGQALEFISECKEYGKGVRKSNPRLNPNIRASLQAVAWTEVNYFNGRVISGVVNYLSSWSNDNKSVAFIFDLQNETLFDQARIVVKSEGLNKLLATEKEKLKEKYNNHKSFCNWIDKQTFDLINIQSNGISFETSFHSVFGKEKIVFPFEEMIPYLRTSEALTLLVK